MSPNPLDSELESFRQQWLSEVRGRSDRPQPSASQPSSSSAQQHQHQQHTAPPPSSSAAPAAARHDDDDDYFEGHTFDEPPIPPGPTLDHDAADAKELVSALDHFEEAMEREAQGNMGDSLKLYRKAYKVRPNPPIHRILPLQTLTTTTSARQWRRPPLPREALPSRQAQAQAAGTSPSTGPAASSKACSSSDSSTGGAICPLLHRRPAVLLLLPDH